MIQNERIAGYQMVLESTAKEPHFNTKIQNVINDSLQFKYKLIHKISLIEEELLIGTLIPGKLYCIWKDLKMKLIKCKRREVIANCQYNEVIALHVVNAALNYTELAPDNRRLIEAQEAVFRQNVHLIRQCNEAAHQFNYPGLIYFN
jgi:hypothetical protein